MRQISTADRTVVQQSMTVMEADYAAALNSTKFYLCVVLSVQMADAEDNRIADQYEDHRGYLHTCTVRVIEDGSGGGSVDIPHVVITPDGRTGVLDYYENLPRPTGCSVYGDQIDGEDAVPPISALYQAEQRPASILELVTRYAAASGVATKTVAVHLPGYLEIPKNWMGVARLQEFICEDYGLPTSWPEHRQAEELYQNSETYLEKIRDVPELVSRLEEVYDNWQRSTKASCLPLYPAVEQFLRELA